MTTDAEVLHTFKYGGEEPDNQEMFGLLIKTFREAKEWQQTDLARAAGMSPSYISRLERGKRDPSRTTVMKLARGLDLASDNTDVLLVAAGLIPNDLANMFALPRLVAIDDMYGSSDNEDFQQYASTEVERLFKALESRSKST